MRRVERSCDNEIGGTVTITMIYPVREARVTITISTAMMEIIRRKGKTQAEPFRPLFRESWRTYKQLDEFWPEAVVEPETDTAALSANLGLTGPSINTAEGLTPQAVRVPSSHE